MSISYNYKSGRIERDFHFVKYGETCRLTNLPAKVGNRYCRENCPFYRCSQIIGANFYVLCGHKEAKDSNDSRLDIIKYNEQIKHEALCALCY